MKLLSRSFFLILLCSLLVGWGFKKKEPVPVIPNCTDMTVTDLVMEIASESMFKQLLKVHLINVVSSSAIWEEAKDTPTGKEYTDLDYNWDTLAMGTIPLNLFMKLTKVSPTAQKAYDDVLQQLRNIKMTLNAIRPAGERPDIQLVGCKAQLAFANGNSIPIKYTAQNTANGQIWVEVDGL